MDYIEQLEQIIEAAKADPTLSPKWRNKAVSSCEDAQLRFAAAEPDDVPEQQPTATIDPDAPNPFIPDSLQEFRDGVQPGNPPQ